MANYNYRLQQQHIAMARKRQRRKAATNAADAARRDMHQQQGQHTPAQDVAGNGVTVNIRQINAGDEGVLYTHRIAERRGRTKRAGFFSKLRNPFSPRDPSDNISLGSMRSGASSMPYLRRNSTSRNNLPGIIGTTLPATPGTPNRPPPQSDTLRGFRSFGGRHPKQYTIASKEKYRNGCLNWIDKHHMNFIDYFWHSNEVDNNVYRPSTLLYQYIDWTFTGSFTMVFITFLLAYCAICVAFGGLLLVAGNYQPNCIVASGESFGHTPHTAFSDAFALSWTTFTTVGYGMTYTSTGGDFGTTAPHKCSWVVFLCTSEAFLGLLFAGMCAAILFGKVNRVQSHANIIFCNAVCLQYEEIDDYPDESEHVRESERSYVGGLTPVPYGGLTPVQQPFIQPIPALADEDEENAINPLSQSYEEQKFVDQFNGCPILKFQVVNELCNREGSELVDCIMKVVGIKFKGPDGRVTHSQYVRVNLVDFEHPFLSRVWHGVHILDATSPLLTDRTRARIRENNGSWPSSWFDPEIIRSKLEFQDLIVTIAGISNVSAVTVHAYKRYKIGDVLIGYNFAPIVFRDIDTGSLDVDISMCHDVREQYGIRGEDLSIRRSPSKESISKVHNNLTSTIRIKKSKSGDGLGSVTSQKSKKDLFSPDSSRDGLERGTDSTEKHSNTGIKHARTHRRIRSEPFTMVISPLPMISPLPSNDQLGISPLEMEDPENPETSEDDIEVLDLSQVVFREKKTA